MLKTIDSIRNPKGFIFDSSLVLYLPLYELDGASFVSKDAYGHLCTVTGALWTPQGRWFDGNDDYLSCPHHSRLNITGALTLELWLKSSSLVGNDGGLISKSADAEKYFGSTVNKVYELGILDSSIAFNISSGTDVAWADGDFASYIDNQWHHIIALWDGTTNANGIRIYADATLLHQGTSSITAIQTKVSVLDIGGYTTLWNFKDYIGEARLYNRALTYLEIQHNYLATKWRYR